MAKINNEYVLDIKNFKKATDTIVKQNKKITKSNKNVERGAKGASKGIKSTGKNVKELGTEFKKGSDEASGFGDALGAIGVGAAFAKGVSLTKEAVGVYANFQAEMKKVKAISGATEEQYKQLNKQAQELGATTAFSASQAAEAQKFFALAGFETNEILAATPKLMQLAAASGEDLGKVSDIVSDQMKAFGLSAAETSEMVDSLAKTATSSNTTVGMLGEALEQGGGTAAKYGGSLEDVLSILGTMADRSIKGSKAGNSLKNLFLRLAAPTDAAAESLKEYNIEAFDSKGNMRNMLDIVGDVQRAMGGMNDEQKAAFETTVFGRESIAGINAILETSIETIKTYSKDIKDAKGATQDMADITMEGLQGEIKTTTSMIEGIKIAATEANETELTNLLKEFQSLQGTLVETLSLIQKMVIGAGKITLGTAKFGEAFGETIAESVRYISTGENVREQKAIDDWVKRSQAGEFANQTGVGGAREQKINLNITVSGDGTGISNKQLNNQVIPALENIFDQNMLSDFNQSNRDKRVK